MQLISSQAANIGLADLDLSWNHIREKGAIAIGKALAVSADDMSLSLVKKLAFCAIFVHCSCTLVGVLLED